MKNEYLSTLNTGRHTLSMIFNDGECVANFEIAGGSAITPTTPASTPTPAGGADKSANVEKITSVKTGDADGISMWIVLIAACIAIGTFAALRRKK